MNILFVFGHSLTIGGHFKSGIAFADQLIKNGAKIFAIISNDDENLVKPFKELGIHCIYLQLSHNQKKNNTIFKKIVNLKKTIYALIQIITKYQVDVVHAQDPIAMIPSYYASCYKKKGFVYSQAGGDFVNCYPPHKGEFFVFSKELYDGYKNTNGYKNKNITIISERFNASIYKPIKVPEIFINKYNLDRNGLTLFFSIRFTKQKQPWINSFIFFIEQIEKINKKIYIIIAGNGDLFDDFVKKAQSISLSTNNRILFKFVGGIYSEIDMSLFYNYSDIVIGNARSLMEAMGCKKPVIIIGKDNEFSFVSNINSDIVSFYNFSGRHFKFINYNTNDIILDTISTLESPESLERISEFSYDYFNTSLSSSVGVDKLHVVYENSLKYKYYFSDAILWHLKKYFS